MASGTASRRSAVREALQGTVKEKGPPVADGVLSVTPDTPEVIEWRQKSSLDTAEASSSFLDDEDDGGRSNSNINHYFTSSRILARNCRCTLFVQAPGPTSSMASSRGRLKASP